MNNSSKAAKGISTIAVIWIVLSSVSTARAQYTDPGSAALLIQIIGSTIFGLIFYFGVFRKWLAGKFSRGEKHAESTPNTGQQLPEERAKAANGNS